MENWYVIQVRSGQEERILRKCRLLIDHAVLHDCFLPKCERMKKMRGHWEKVEELLFRGYVFLISDDVQALYHELYKIDDLTKLLGKHGEVIWQDGAFGGDVCRLYGGRTDRCYGRTFDGERGDDLQGGSP